MKPLRFLLAMLLAAAAVAVIANVMVPRLRCNRVKGEVNTSVRRLHRIGNDYERIARARRNLQRCEQCLTIFPDDHQLHILRGANLRVIGSYDEALRALERSLELTERPETYAQIGEIEMERGNVEAARTALLKAATFNIRYVMMVDQPMRDELYTAVYERIDRLREGRRKADSSAR